MSKFRDFEFRADPNVYINREIQEVPVLTMSHYIQWKDDSG